MSRNFVIAFGGTGARAIEALSYLAASGCFSSGLHILIVDPDETNGNVSEALKQLRRYQSIQAQVKRPSGSDGAPFFSTPVNDELGPSSFLWTNPQPNQEFQTLIQYSSQSPEERQLLQLLYDESDMALTFEKGYIGRAHVGSLDLLRNLLRQMKGVAAEHENAPTSNVDSLHTFFRELRAATQQPDGARLLVIGSVFGGTGASGLPAIPPLISEVLLSGLEGRLTQACVQLAPYFTFPQGREEDPDSVLHPLATQAALQHYALTDTGYDRVYLIGAPTKEESNAENVPGGEAQKNKAHYVELAAGLAAVHFFQGPDTGGSIEVIACGSDAVMWDQLPSRKIAEIRRRLVSFATYCILHGRFLASALAERRHIGAKWEQDLRSARDRHLGGQEPQLRAMQEFATRFLDWTREVARMDYVKLLNVSDSVSEDALSEVTEGAKKTPHPFHEMMKSLNSAGEVDQNTGVGWYVDALTQSTTTYCAKNYSSWWA